MEIEDRLAKVKVFLSQEAKDKILSILNEFEPLIHHTDFSVVDRKKNRLEIFSTPKGFRYSDKKYTNPLVMKISQTFESDENTRLYLGRNLRDSYYLLGAYIRDTGEYKIWIQNISSGKMGVILISSKDLTIDNPLFVSKGTSQTTIIMKESEHGQNLLVFRLDFSFHIINKFVIKDSNINAVIDSNKDIYASIHGEELQIWRLVDDNGVGNKNILSVTKNVFSSSIITVYGNTIAFETPRKEDTIFIIGRISSQDYKIKKVKEFDNPKDVELLSEYSIAVEHERYIGYNITKYDKDWDVKTTYFVAVPEYGHIEGISNDTFVITEPDVETDVSDTLQVYREIVTGKYDDEEDTRLEVLLDLKDGRYIDPYPTDVSNETLNKTSELMGKYLKISTSLLNIISGYI